MRSLKRRDELGASAVVVAVSLVAIFGAALLAIDTGLLWRQRRVILTATDAAALAEARAAALAPVPVTSCGGLWTTYVARNAGSSAEPISCTVRPGTIAGAGSVEVQARTTSPVRFGGVLGVADGKPFASSIARYGFITEAEGLRPMGICVQNVHVAEWLAYRNGTLPASVYNALRGSGPGHPVYAGAGVVHRISYTKDNPAACGSAPGNWGFFDYNGGANSNADLVNWILYGYYGNRVGIGDCNAEDGSVGEPCSADTGSAGGSIQGALNQILGTQFAVPVFDLATGSGGTTTYRISHFIGVIMRGFRVMGAEAQRYLDLEFVNLVLEGNCCSYVPPGVDTGIRSVRLCSVDHDPISETIRCG